jgi:hypothetical protein
MILAGVLTTLLGFVLAVLSLAITQSAGGRFVIALAGLVLSLTGIMGVLNRAYLKNAIWRK